MCVKTKYINKTVLLWENGHSHCWSGEACTDDEQTVTCVRGWGCQSQLREHILVRTPELWKACGHRVENILSNVSMFRIHHLEMNTWWNPSWNGDRGVLASWAEFQELSFDGPTITSWRNDFSFHTLWNWSPFESAPSLWILFIYSLRVSYNVLWLYSFSLPPLPITQLHAFPS